MIYKLFHGTDNTFDNFDFNKIGENAHAYGYGFYFTDSPKVASFYGKNIMEAVVEINNPIIDGVFEMPFYKAINWAKSRIQAGVNIFEELGFDTLRNDEAELWQLFEDDFLRYQKDEMEFVHEMRTIGGFDSIEELLIDAKKFLDFDGVQVTKDAYNDEPHNIYIIWSNAQIVEKTWIK